MVTFYPRSQPLEAGSAEALARVTAAAFGQRRKMLRASLKQLTPFADLLLREGEIDPKKRAEELSVAEFARLAAIYARGDLKATTA